MDFGSEAAQKGSTVDIPLSSAQTASDVTAAPTYSSAQAATPGLIQLSLNQWKHSDFYLTDKEMAEIDRNRHFVPMQQAEAVKVLANTMDTHIHNQYTGVYGYVGTAGVIPFSTVATATDARKVLNTQLAPMGERFTVLDPTAEGQALQLAAFSDFEKTNDRPVKIDGELGRKLGFDHFMSQNIVTHTAGTAASIIVGSATAAGVSSLDLKTGSSASDGTLLVGDVFTIAGDTQTYTVKTSVNISTVAVEVDISPALAAAASSEVVTLKATHVVNLAFNRGAFAFATRPLDAGVNTNPFFQATDSVTGFSLRVEVIRQYKQTAFDYDVLYGALLVRPQFAARIAG